MASKEQTIGTIKRSVRRAAWVANNLFWTHVMPVAAGVVQRTGSMALARRLPGTRTSPWATQVLVAEETVDGALLVGTAASAWAKYALPKGLPEEGGKVLGIENEPHFVDDFSGEIPQGYGKGVKTLLLSDNVVVKVAGKTSVQKINYHVHKTVRSGGREHYDIVVTGVPPNTWQWELNIPRGQYKGRYAFVQAGQGTIVTRMKDQGIRLDKPDYTLRKEESLEKVDPTKSIIERKVDGSLGNAHVQGYRVAFRSHRELEGAGTYYDKLPAVEFLRNESSFLFSRLLYPGPQLTGTIFQGELSHPDGSARVSGILNALPQNARAIQEVRGPVKFIVWDILKYKGRDLSDWPYEDRRKLYLQVVKEIRHTNKYWDAMDAAPPGVSAKQFYEFVTSEPLPWGEGVVIKPIDMKTQKWDKIKMHGFGYFKLVNVLPGEGKYADTVGRLVVENPENGARGEVGSLSVPDEFRDWIWANRDELVGETVKVRSQAVTARGVPRAGVFYGFHNGEVDLLMQAESLTGGDPKASKQMVYRLKSAAGWRRKQ